MARGANDRHLAKPKLGDKSRDLKRLDPTVEKNEGKEQPPNEEPPPPTSLTVDSRFIMIKYITRCFKLVNYE
jgi:hypothetical protein